jgi:uncharacterized membrane protein
MVIMAIVGLVLFLVVIGGLWYLIARRTPPETVARADFDAVYDERVAKGEILEEGREDAWRQLRARQDREERERLTWLEGEDE